MHSWLSHCGSQPANTTDTINNSLSYNISTTGKLKSKTGFLSYCIRPYPSVFYFSPALCLFLLCFQILNMFSGWNGASQQRQKILPERTSLRAVLQPTATPLCSKVEWCLVDEPPRLKVLQHVVCVHICVCLLERERQGERLPGEVSV